MTEHIRGRRVSWLAATILLAIALLAPELPGARIAVTAGSVEIGRGEPPVWTPAETGVALGAGDRVRTGADGKAEVTVAGASVRLYPNSLLRLPASAPQGGDAVELREGTSLFDVLRRARDSFEVRTPEVVISVKGTRFAVAVGDHDASVSVFRGLVGVRGDAQAPAAEMLVHPGFQAHGSDHFELSWRGIDDPWEAWTEGELDTELLRGAPVEAVLQDVRLATLDLQKDVHVPASRAPESGPDRDRDGGLDGDTHNGPPERDPVADAGNDVKRGIVQEVIANILNGPDNGQGGGPGGPTGPILDIVFVDGSGVPGPDVVQVLDGVTTWVFEEDQLEDILDDDESLPADLLAILDTQGIEEELFTNQLLGLFGGGGGGDDDDDDDDDD
jgi:hypothetical protein